MKRGVTEGFRDLGGAKRQSIGVSWKIRSSSGRKIWGCAVSRQRPGRGEVLTY